MSPYISPMRDGSPSAPGYPPPAPPSHGSYTNIPIQRSLREIERLERIPGAQKIELYKASFEYKEFGKYIIIFFSFSGIFTSF